MWRCLFLKLLLIHYALCQESIQTGTVEILPFQVTTELDGSNGIDIVTLARVTEDWLREAFARYDLEDDHASFVGIELHVQEQKATTAKTTSFAVSYEGTSVWNISEGKPLLPNESTISSIQMKAMEQDLPLLLVALQAGDASSGLGEHVVDVQAALITPAPSFSPSSEPTLEPTITKSPSSSPSPSLTSLETNEDFIPRGEMVNLVPFDVTIDLTQNNGVDVLHLTEIMENFLYEAFSNVDLGDDHATFTAVSLNYQGASPTQTTFVAFYEGTTVWISTGGRSVPGEDLVAYIQAKAFAAEKLRLLDSLHKADKSSGLGEYVMDVRVFNNDGTAILSCGLAMALSLGMVVVNILL